MGEFDGQNQANASALHAAQETAMLLQQASIRPEALAEYVPAGKRLLVLPRPATMRPLTEVWRLGSLLLGVDHSLWAAGPSTRAAERGRLGYQSLSREERRDIAAAALRGGYALGQSVNFDAVPIHLDEASLHELNEGLPVGFSNGELRVRWRAGAPLEGAPTLARYFKERAALLIEREGA